MLKHKLIRYISHFLQNNCMIKSTYSDVQTKNEVWFNVYYKGNFRQISAYILRSIPFLPCTSYFHSMLDSWKYLGLRRYYSRFLIGVFYPSCHAHPLQNIDPKRLQNLIPIAVADEMIVLCNDLIAEPEYTVSLLSSFLILDLRDGCGIATKTKNAMD